MGFFTKDRPAAGHGPTSKLKRRAAALTDAELPGWANTCLYETGRRLSDYANGDDVALTDAIAASDALSVVLAEMAHRRDRAF